MEYPTPDSISCNCCGNSFWSYPDSPEVTCSSCQAKKRKNIKKSVCNSCIHTFKPKSPKDSSKEDVS